MSENATRQNRKTITVALTDMCRKVMGEFTCMHGGKDFTRLGSMAALRLSKAPDFSSYLLPR